MNTRRALQKVSGAACLAVSLVVAHPSEAVEYGFGEYFLGLTIPMSGYLPPPGVYFQNTFLLYGGSRPALDANLVTDIAQLGYYLDADVFGGTFGLFATIPFVGDRNSVPVPGTLFRLNAEISSIADTDYAAVLGWHAGDSNWCIVLTGFAPTGNYNQTGLCKRV